MIKVFVITLPESKDRQQFIAAQLNSLNIPFEFVFGIDGRKLGETELEKLYDPKKAIQFNKRELASGEIGCSLSHRLVYKRIIEDNIERAIILEDDIHLKDDFAIVITMLANIKTSNYLIKLDNKLRKQTVPWHKIKLNEEYCIQHPLTSCTWAWGYYIDIVAAKTIFDLTEIIFTAADDWNYFKRFIKLRLLNKEILDETKSIESIIGIERDEKYLNRIGGINMGGGRLNKFIDAIITLFH